MECGKCQEQRKRTLAGQGFTERECDLCNEIVTYSSTRVDKYCDDCSALKNICKHCGDPMPKEITTTTRKN